MNYILAISAGKLFIPLYFRGCPNNFAKFEPKPYFIALIVISTLIQVIILKLQKIFGPKFFLPRSFRNESHNYYTDLNEELYNEAENVII